jgi:hypothetical protein
VRVQASQLFGHPAAAAALQDHRLITTGPHAMCPTQCTSACCCGLRGAAYLQEPLIPYALSSLLVITRRSGGAVAGEEFGEVGTLSGASSGMLPRRS